MQSRWLELDFRAGPEVFDLGGGGCSLAKPVSTSRTGNFLEFSA
jgi:hypothetical protein